jgi:ketosteroid isomerase-like protein
VSLCELFGIEFCALFGIIVSSSGKRQLEAIGKKNDEAFTKGDAATVAARFTENAVLVTPRGLVHG